MMSMGEDSQQQQRRGTGAGGGEAAHVSAVGCGWMTRRVEGRAVGRAKADARAGGAIVASAVFFALQKQGYLHIAVLEAPQSRR